MGFEARALDLEAAVAYVNGDLRKALSIYQRSLPMHERADDLDGTADVLTNMASMRSFLGEHDSALAQYARGLRIHEEIHDSMAIANDLNAIGRVHMVRGDHARAVDYFRRSIKLQRILRNERGIATSQINLGALYILQGDYTSAIAPYMDALRMARNLKDDHMSAKALVEIGTCQEALGDTSAARASYAESLRLRRGIGDAQGLLNATNKLGDLLRAQGRWVEAAARYKEAIAITDSIEHPFGHATALIGLARIHLNDGKPSKALDLGLAAERIAREAGDISLDRDAAALLFDTYKALGRNGEALARHERFLALNDSLMRERNQREVLRFEYAYNYEQQALRDSLNNVAATVRAEADQREKRLWLTGLLSIACVLGAAAWLRMLYVARTKKEIVRTQTELVASERAREATEVRIRIARDVHDQLGSDLTKLVMLGTEAKEVARTDSTRISNIASDIERIAGEANRSLGDIVWAIDPHHDSLAGLTERVRTYCERMFKYTTVEHTIDCIHEGPDRSLNPATKRDIYLMMREALNNTLKHADAKHISVRFISSATQVEFEIKDDGEGMSVDPRNGHGLTSMHLRAKRTGGTLAITSTAGIGTCVTFRAVLGAEAPGIT